MSKPILVLVDGSAVFHRGYHAIPHLSNSRGEPTNAVYGFVTILFKVIADLSPTYLIVAWDKSSKTFRNDMYDQYKATRSAMDDDLRVQIAPVKAMVEVLGLPLIEVENYEADDIIGTLARQAEERGDLETVIATGDRDQLQLIDERTVVDMFNPRGLEPTRYNLAKMQEKYGLTPQQFIDYKAIVGDTSDNIPGVKGIGDKGAQKLLAEYKTLDGIYEHVDEVAGKTGEYLRNSRDIAYLSKKLSTIVCDMPLQLDLERAEVGNYDRTAVHEMFAHLEFRGTLLSKLPPNVKEALAEAEGAERDDGGASSPHKGAGDTGKAQSGIVTAAGARAGSAKQSLFGDHDMQAAGPVRTHLDHVTYTCVTTQAQLLALVKNLSAQPAFAFDTETTSVDTIQAQLVGLSFCWQAREAYYVPVGHIDGVQLELDYVINTLKPVLENPDIAKVGHNIKYDYEMLKRYGVTVTPIGFDTMIAAFLLNSIGRAQSLDDLAFKELAVEMIPISELIGTGKNQTSFDHVAIETATTYAAEDADMTWRLYEILHPRLNGYAQINEYGWNVARLAEDIEWPMVPVLGDMELKGIELDKPALAAFGKQLTGRIGELKTNIYDLAGEEFNLNSPAQLGQILYGRLGLSTAGLKKGKTGVSTAADVLEKLRDAHPVIPLLMEFRELDKLGNTYVDALPEMVKADGRIHTSFSQVIAQTGRLSSSNPNLQNIPVRTELGREIRRAFVAPAGRKLVSADYSQIELRVAAALAGDENMIETFRKGVDLHQETAALLYGVELADVSKEQRSAAKTINFGVLYGMSAHGLSVATGMDGKEAAVYIERYFEVRPKLKDYIEQVKAFAYQHEYTETLFGRRRPCPEIHSSNFNLRMGAERMAVNVPIQGTAADIYKLAMLEVDKRLDDNCQLLLQIHDELIVEAPEDQAEEVAAMMAEVMSGVIDIGVPLAVDTAVGQHWGEL